MIKNIKILILVFVFIFNFQIALADSCDELKPIIDKYYQTSQEENIGSYMEVMDIEYLRENLLNNYEDYVKSAWEVYDTKDYELKLYNCRIENKEALMYLNLKSILLSQGEEVETQRNYVARFHNVDGWKIKYVMDDDVFSQFQSSLHTELFLDATRDELIKSLDDSDVLLEYAQLEKDILANDFDDTISEGVQKKDTKKNIDHNYKEKESNKTILILLIIIIPIIVYIAKKKKKS